MMHPRILIVDDERDIIDSLKKGLARRGFDVDVIDDPKAALDGFGPEMYDLVFLDMKMPKMDGFELYREIKKKDSKTQIVFLTAFEIQIDKISKVFPGLTIKNFLQKPASIAEMVNCINEHTHEQS